MLPVVILGNVFRILTQTDPKSDPTGSTLLPFFGEKIQFYGTTGVESQIQVLSEKSYLIPIKTQFTTTSASTQFSPSGNYLLTRNNARSRSDSKSVVWEIKEGELMLKQELSSLSYFDTSDNLVQVAHKFEPLTSQNGRLKFDLSVGDNKQTLEAPIQSPNLRDFTLASLPITASQNTTTAFHFKNPKNDLQTHITAFVNIQNSDLSIKSLPPHDRAYLSADGQKYIFYDSSIQSITIQNVASSESINIPTPNPITAFAALDSKYYFSSSLDNSDLLSQKENSANQVITIINSNTLEQEVPINLYMNDKIRKIIPINDKFIIIVNEDGVINFLDTETNGLQRTITNPSLKTQDSAVHFYYDSVSISQDHKILAAVDPQNVVYIWPMDIKISSER
jgi:hypothetical protein